MNFWHKITGFIKEHPYGVAAGVFIVGIIYLLLRGSSSGNTSATSNTTAAETQSQIAAETQAAEQLQAAQLSATTQQDQIQAQASSVAENDNAQQNIAQIQANTSVSNTTTADDASAYIASLTATTNQDQISAQASVDNNQIAANVTTTQDNDQALEEVALAPYEVEMDEINQNVAGLTAQNQSLISTISNAVTGLGNWQSGLGYQTDYTNVESNTYNVVQDLQDELTSVGAPKATTGTGGL